MQSAGALEAARRGPARAPRARTTGRSARCAPRTRCPPALPAPRRRSPRTAARRARGVADAGEPGDERRERHAGIHQAVKCDRGVVPSTCTMAISVMRPPARALPPVVSTSTTAYRHAPSRGWQRRSRSRRAPSGPRASAPPGDRRPPAPGQSWPPGRAGSRPAPARLDARCSRRGPPPGTPPRGSRGSKRGTRRARSQVVAAQRQRHAARAAPAPHQLAALDGDDRPLARRPPARSAGPPPE